MLSSGKPFRRYLAIQGCVNTLVCEQRFALGRFESAALLAHFRSLFKDSRIRSMIRTTLLFALFAFAVSKCVLSQLPEPPFKKTAEVEGVSEYLLANNCRVLLVPDDSSNSVTVNMTVLVGSRHEGYGEAGMAHLLEHMLFKGTPSHGDIDKELKERGVLDMNGTTDYDRTNYYETLPASDENLNWTIAMEADRLANCFIRGEDLFSEMTVVRNEFEAGEDSPNSILMQRIMANAYEWHNYGKSVIGNRADIERVPVNRLRAFYKKYYRPDNVVLIVAGKFDPEKAIAAAVTHFGSLEKAGSPLEPTYTVEPTQDGERIVYLNRVGEVALIGVAYHVPAMAHADSAALTVLEHILGTEPSGRLYQSLVKTRQASAVTSMHQAGYDPGMFGCLIQINRDIQVDTVRESLSKILQGIVKDGVTEEEVNRAIRELTNETEKALTNTGTLSYQLSNWIAYGDWRLFFLNRDRIESVKPEDVKRVAELYLKDSNRTTGIFVPTPAPDRSAIAQRPKIDSLVSGYTGRELVSKGEQFAPTPENIAARTFRGKLDSGLKYALLPKQVRGDRFFLKLTLRFGNEATLNTPKNLQASKLLGDAWLLGTEKFNEAALKDKLDELKAECTASSESGAVTFQVTGRKKNFAETISLLTEILRHPTFPNDEFELLKTQKRSEIESARTDPNYLAQVALSRKLAPVSTTSIHYVPTTDESLERLGAVQVSDVRELVKRFISGTHGEITAVGAFDKEPAIIQFNAMTSDWKSAEPYTRIAKPFLKVEPETISIETPDKENAVLMAAANLEIRSDDPDWEAIYIANDILGGGSLSSRLGERVREQEGLSYGVGSHFIAKSLDRSAVFMTFAITNPINRDKLVSTIDEVFDDFMKNGVKEAEIESAKTSYLKQLEETLSNDSQLMSTLHQYQEADRDESFLSRRQRNVKGLTKATVDAVVKKLLNQKKLVIVTAGDFQGKK